MKDPQNITIALLAASAAILAALLVFTLDSRPAMADASVRAGDYVVVTGAFGGTKDLVYVIDVPAMRMNSYSINIQKNAIDLHDSVPLDKVFGAAR